MRDPKRAPGEPQPARGVVRGRRGGPRPDETAGYHLTATARRFAHRSRTIVDDKLSFSATLLRAGEVRAASRVFAEVEHDLAEEKAALFEAVGEARAAEATGAELEAEGHPVRGARVPARRRQARRRIVRLVALAALSAASLSVSALGVALAAMISERIVSSTAADARGDRASFRRDAATPNREVDSVRIAPGVAVPMHSEARRLYRRLANDGKVDAVELRAFLALLPPKVAVLVTETIATGATALQIETEALMSVLESTGAAATEAEGGSPATSSSESEGDASGDEAGHSGPEGGADEADEPSEGDDGGSDAEDPLYLEELFEE